MMTPRPDSTPLVACATPLERVPYSALFFTSVVRPAALAELRDKLLDTTGKVLTDQLRQLEQDGVIQRYAAQSMPPMVSYSLNAEGEKLVPMMESLCDWGSAHFHIKPNLPRPQADASFSR
jgi:DNA-binding HxlR family transcriptional regulator